MPQTYVAYSKEGEKGDSNLFSLSDKHYKPHTYVAIYSCMNI